MKAGLRSLIADAELICRIALIRECVSGVIQHSVEDHKQILHMGGVHKAAQLIVGRGRIVGETRFGADEVVDAIAVVCVLIEPEIL